MEITEILQVLESHRDSLRHTMQIIRELAPTPDRLAILADFDREIRAFEEAAAILRQVPDQVPLTLEQLREMDGEPVYIIEEGRGGHWELSENAEDYLEGRDLREYGKRWEAYPCKPSLTGWISVEERLPDNEKPVLAYYGFYREDDDLGARFIGTLTYFCYDPEPHWKHESTGLFVTHWMPLPEPPEKNAEAI